MRLLQMKGEGNSARNPTTDNDDDGDGDDDDGDGDGDGDGDDDGDDDDMDMMTTMIEGVFAVFRSNYGSRILN